jgi:hypothetical protein
MTAETVSTTVSHDILQPIAAEIVPSFDVLLDLDGSRADRRGNFKPPPHRPHFTVLCI